MRVAIYDRVSTKKQDTENQAVPLREFAQRMGWTVTHEFTDIVSGTKDERNRPQFKRMMECAYRRDFDVLLFWALDRFSREGTRFTHGYLGRLDDYGVAWKSYTEQYFDTTGIFKEAVISILATIAKQEVVRRSERIKAGLYNPDNPGYSRKGKKLGRSRVADHEASPQCLYMRRKRAIAGGKTA